MFPFYREKIKYSDANWDKSGRSTGKKWTQDKRLWLRKRWLFSSRQFSLEVTLSGSLIFFKNESFKIPWFLSYQVGQSNTLMESDKLVHGWLICKHCYSSLRIVLLSIMFLLNSWVLSAQKMKLTFFVDSNILKQSTVSNEINNC